MKLNQVGSSIMAEKLDPDSENAPEEKKKVLYIVKSKESAGKGFETFLRNRNWEVISTSDLKQALAGLLTQPIYCALITVDHPNPKCNRLPGIIGQTIKVPVILYSEGVNQNGINQLRAANHPYVLYPPVSGPAIERMILKIEKDQAQSADEKKSSDQRSGSPDRGVNENDRTAVRGKGDYSMDEIVRLFEGEGQAEMKSAEAGQIQVGGKNAPADGVAGDHYASGGKANEAGTNSPNQNGLGGNEGPSFTPSSRDQDSEIGDLGSRELGQKAGVDSIENRNAGPKHLENKTDSAFSGKAGDSEIGNQNFSNQGSVDAMGADRTGTLQGKLTSSEEAPRNSSSSKNGGEKEKKKNNSAPAKATRANFGQDGGFSIRASKSGKNFAEGSKESSLLIKGAEHALSRAAVNRSPSELHTKRIVRCSRVSCFEVVSDRFSGYVIVAFGMNRDVDQEFNNTLSKYLVDYLKRNGILIKLAELPSLKLMEVGFEDWSLQEAAFLRAAVHDDSEIAVAFFPGKDKSSPLELSTENHMYKMKLNDIRKNEVLEFDIYVYLPVNKKYVRYAARDRLLPGERVDRLTTGGVDGVHVKKEAERDVIRYRVQNFLNDTIKSYQQKKSA